MLAKREVSIYGFATANRLSEVHYVVKALPFVPDNQIYLIPNKSCSACSFFKLRSIERSVTPIALANSAIVIKELS